MRSVRVALLCCAVVSTAALAACGHEASPTSVTVPQPPSAARPTTPPAERPLGAFTVTCHTGSGRTASGRTDGPGLVAVDPAVLPLGTRIRVEKVGVVTAADRGGAVDGRALDVWTPNEAACTAFGRQRLEVWRLGG